MKKYQCVVFDWDGTLMDSIEKIVECLQAAALDVGLIRNTEPCENGHRVRIAHMSGALWRVRAVRE